MGKYDFSKSEHWFCRTVPNISPLQYLHYNWHTKDSIRTLYICTFTLCVMSHSQHWSVREEVQGHGNLLALVRTCKWTLNSGRVLAVSSNMEAKKSLFLFMLDLGFHVMSCSSVWGVRTIAAVHQWDID